MNVEKKMAKAVNCKKAMVVESIEKAICDFRTKMSVATTQTAKNKVMTRHIIELYNLIKLQERGDI